MVTRNEFVENYRGGTIKLIQLSDRTFYTWRIYRRTDGTYLTSASITSQKLDELKAAVDSGDDVKK
jgi:hypothetical protein